LKKWRNKLKFFKIQNLFSFIIFLLFLFASFIKEPWHDELYTKFIVQKSTIDILKELKKDSGPPFYYILIHYLCFPFNYNIFFIRFFSSLFIFSSAFVLFKIFKEYFKIEFPHYIYLIFPIPFFYSAEARNYSLLILLSSLFFYEILIKKRTLFITFYLTLLLYSHNLSFFFIIYALTFYFYYKEKKYIISTVASIILYIPVLFLLKNQPKESIFWIGKSFDFQKFSTFFSNLGPNLFENFIYNFKPIIPSLLFSLINLSLILFLLKKKILKPIILAFFINFLILFFICYKIINIYIPSRSEVFFFVPFAIILFNLKEEKYKFLKHILILYFIISILSLFITLSSFSKPLNFREDISKIIKLAKANTEIYVIGPLYLTTNYALEREGLKNTLKQFPPSQGEHYGWYYYPKLKEEDKKWLLENLSLNDKSYLVIWITEDPIGREIKNYLSHKGKIGIFGNFMFYLKE